MSPFARAILITSVLIAILLVAGMLTVILVPALEWMEARLFGT